MKQTNILPWLLGFALLVGAPVASVASDLFTPTTDVGGEALALSGQGVLKYKRIISVYDAALYLPRGVTADRALEDIPRRLEVVYRVSAKAERFAKAGNDVLARMFPVDQLAALQERVDLIHGWFPDHQKRDRCAITYIPGRGTELTYNGESMGIIPGEDFGRAYFSIWLGSDPASEALRDDLLNL